MNKISLYDSVILHPLNAEHDDGLDVQIVPPHESDAVAGKISMEAPVGRAVLNRRSGDTVNIDVHGRSIRMKIHAVRKHREAIH